MNTAHLLILIVLLAAWLTSWVGAVMSIASPLRPMQPLARGGWIAATLIFPIAGPLLWFTIGRSRAPVDPTVTTSM